MIRPKHSLLYFPAIEWVRSGISKAVIQHGNIPMVLDCRSLNGLPLYVMILNAILISLFIEFDFTVARGLGALHKELSALNVPLVLLGPVPAVQTVLNGALSTAIPEVSTETELDQFFQNSYGAELKEVSTPLLQTNNGHNYDSTTPDQAEKCK